MDLFPVLSGFYTLEFTDYFSMKLPLSFIRHVMHIKKPMNNCMI